jgi:short-subunit dehydrogenase
MITQNARLHDSLVIITGAGYKEANRFFQGSSFDDIIEVQGRKFKLNIGAATAKHLVELGTEVCIISSTEEKLYNLKEHICKTTNCHPSNINYYAADLTNSGDVKRIFEKIRTNKPLWLVHCVGLGSQMYQVHNDNPYLSFKDISPELVSKEFDVPVNSLLLMMKNMEPLFSKQFETRIVVVTSMSGIRPILYGYSHSAAKAGIHHAVRSLSLELSLKYESVYLTEILPGIVDTGLYDSDEVIDAVQQVSASFGLFGNKSPTPDQIPVMPPSSVAETIGMALQSKAHILSVNLVGQGQFTNMGA